MELVFKEVTGNREIGSWETESKYQDLIEADTDRNAERVEEEPELNYLIIGKIMHTEERMEIKET